jgi:hypothetical protein
MAEPLRPVILDLSDNTVHVAGREHLTTRCGIYVDAASVGPLRALVGRAMRFCTACWEAVPSATVAGQTQLWERT